MASTIQFWGLGSGLSNTAELIDAMLISDTQKIKGYESKITLNNAKKNAWSDLKSSVNALNDIINNLSGVGKQNFAVATTSVDGYLNASASSKAINMDYSIHVQQLATKHTVSSKKYANKDAALNLSGSFKVNGVNIDVTANDSLTTIMNKINAKDSNGNSTTGARAYIIDGVLAVESIESGDQNMLSFEDTNGLLKNMGLIKADNSMNTTKAAKNAIIRVNGIEIERQSNTISDAIDGVTLNLTRTTTSDITLSVGNDTTALKTTIKDLINAYNSVIKKASSYTNYNSASGSSGVLNGDTSVNTVKSTLASAMQGSYAGGEFSFLFDLGISVDKFGQYQIDEAKLDNALKNNSDGVISFFTKGLDNPNSPANSSSGLLVSMKKSINNLIGGATNLFSAKESSIDNQIKNYNDLIDKTNSYIEKRRATLEAQFAALETTMNSINTTSSMLTQMSNASKND